MIIFLCGQDTYRSHQKLDEIIGHYRKIHKSGLNFKIFDLEEKTYQDFKSEFDSVSMFKEKKLLILKNAFSNEDFKEKFLSRVEKFKNSEEVILFYEEKEAPKDKFFKSLKKFSKFQEFEPLDDLRLKIWLKAEFKKYGAEISEKNLDKLINFVGNNLWQMANEIKKLISYKKIWHKKEATASHLCQKIKEEDIELLVKPKIESVIFETIDAIAAKDKKRALRLLKKHLEKGDPPLYLLSMINFQFRNLLIIKDALERNRSPYNLRGLHPYVIRKSYALSKKFSLAELKKIYQKIFQVDLNIKTGKIEPETALDLLIAEI